MLEVMEGASQKINRGIDVAGSAVLVTGVKGGWGGARWEVPAIIQARRGETLN